LIRLVSSGGRLSSLLSQIALSAQAQYIAFLRVAEAVPVKPLFPAAQAATTVTACICLADPATGTGYREKL